MKQDEEVCHRIVSILVSGRSVSKLIPHLKLEAREILARRVCVLMETLSDVPQAEEVGKPSCLQDGNNPATGGT
jgi:hypothetical protein